jgi:AIG2-like family
MLHHFEGYDPYGPREENRHLFEEIVVDRLGVGRTAAMTYVAVPDGTDALPSKTYLGHIIAGARHHGLPKTYLAYLERVRTQPG